MKIEQCWLSLSVVRKKNKKSLYLFLFNYPIVY